MLCTGLFCDLQLEALIIDFLVAVHNTRMLCRVSEKLVYIFLVQCMPLTKVKLVRKLEDLYL